MRRKSIAILLSAMLALATLAGCGDNTQASAETTPSTETVVQPAGDTRAESTVTATTEKPTEEVKEEKEEPTAQTEVVTASTETSTTEEKPAQSDVDTSAPTETPAEVQDPEPQLSPIDQMIKDNGIEAYIKDGVFDVEGYGASIGADLSYLYADNPMDFLYLFGNQTWFIQAGCDSDHPGKGFISIGKWDPVNHPDWWNAATYSYVFDYGEGISTTGGFSISKQTLAYLPAVVAATSGPDAAPNVSGATFKPCDYNDAFAQH